MNWQIFFSTFLLIFLAELGDKTQLAVMAQSAGSSSKWIVFIAGSVALILSTAIGVLAGDLISRFVPDMRVIKLCGGVMFLLFGALMLVDLCRKKEPEVVTDGQVTTVSDWMSRHVIQHAAVFEEAAVKHYQELAAGEKDSRARDIFEWLAKEEMVHLNAMKSGMLVSTKEDEIAMTHAIIGDMPPIKKLLLESGAAEVSSRQQIIEVIEGEEAQVQFYKALAAHCKIPRLRDTFAALAVAEGRHVEKLRGLLN
jgi:rubrerythrin